MSSSSSPPHPPTFFSLLFLSLSPRFHHGRHHYNVQQVSIQKLVHMQVPWPSLALPWLRSRLASMSDPRRADWTTRHGRRSARLQLWARSPTTEQSSSICDCDSDCDSDRDSDWQPPKNQVAWCCYSAQKFSQAKTSATLFTNVTEESNGVFYCLLYSTPLHSTPLSLLFSRVLGWIRIRILLTW